MVKQKEYSLILFFRELGNYLSSLIMPNLSVFIAWGLINFLANFVDGKMYTLLNGTEDILINFLLPLLIGYTGGKKIDTNRGGAIAGIATLGVMVGNENSAVLGAMILGPLAVLLFEKVNTVYASRMKNGYEMLVQNVLAGLIGTLFCLIGLFVLTPMINYATILAIQGVYWSITHHLLPFVSIIIEPLKVLFFNNAINHGLLTPLGLNMVKESGQSILFLLEVNPGPGFGILVAYTFFGNRDEKKQGAGASMIHILGGIHEVYFPFVLKEPKLFFVAILSGMTGTAIFEFFDVGLTTPVSPGSIILMLISAPMTSKTGVLLGVLGSALVSFLLSVFILKNKSISVNKVEYEKESKKMISEIIVACDAGIGSSAMGASLMKQALNNMGDTTPVTNTSIYDVENKETSLVLVHGQLRRQLEELAPQVKVVEVDNFLDIDQNLKSIQQFLQTKDNDQKTIMTLDSKQEIELVLLYENNVRGSQTMASELMRTKADSLGISLCVTKKDIDVVVFNETSWYVVTEEINKNHHLEETTNRLLVMKDLFNMTEFESWLKGVLS